MNEIQQESLSDDSSHTLQALMNATINIESLADVMESELSVICKKFIDHGLDEDEESLALYAELTRTVGKAFDKLLVAIKNNDENAAAEVISLRENIRHAVDAILKNQAGRIGVLTNQELLQIRLELEIVDQLRRIYTLTKRVAREFVPGELAVRSE
jgi:phosphate:Na+ symporter